MIEKSQSEPRFEDDLGFNRAGDDLTEETFSQSVSFLLTLQNGFQFAHGCDQKIGRKLGERFRAESHLTPQELTPALRAVWTST